MTPKEYTERNRQAHDQNQWNRNNKTNIYIESMKQRIGSLTKKKSQIENP